MIRRSKGKRLTLLVGAMALLSLAPCAVRAQGEEDEEEVQVLNARRAQVMWNDDTIDQWVFGGGRNGQQSRKRLETQLSLRIDELDRVCILSEIQKKKLHLAGQGDIKRLYDQIGEIRRKYDKQRNEQNAVNQIFQEIQPLQSRVNSGLFNAESFYQKSVLKTLGPEQTAKVDQLEYQRRVYRYRSKILLAMTMLDVVVPLRNEQRQALIQLLENETKPPKRFGQYDFHVIMLQLAKLPEEKVKPLFDDAQWKAMQNPLRQAKGLEQYLTQNGFLDLAPAKVNPEKLEPSKVEPEKKAEAKPQTPEVEAKKNP